MRPWRVFRATTHAAAAAVAPTRARHSARVTAPPTSGPSAQQAQPLRGGIHPPSREARPSRPGEKKCAMAIEALGWRQIGLWRARGTPSGCERQPRRPRWFGGTSRVSSRASFARVGRASRLGVPIAHFFSLRSAERGLRRARGTTLGCERPPRRLTRVGRIVRVSPSASLARGGRASRLGEAIAHFFLHCNIFVGLHEIFRAIARNFSCNCSFSLQGFVAHFFFGCTFFFWLQHFCVRCTKQGFAAHFLYPAGHTSRAGL